MRYIKAEAGGYSADGVEILHSQDGVGVGVEIRVGAKNEIPAENQCFRSRKKLERELEMELELFIRRMEQRLERDFVEYEWGVLDES